MKENKKYFLRRCLSRIIDYFFLLFLANLLTFLGVEGVSILGMYISYNLIFAFFQGQTIGKGAVGLEIKTSSKFHYLLREAIFLFFFPFVAIHFLFCSNRAFHEKMSNSYLKFE